MSKAPQDFALDEGMVTDDAIWDEEIRSRLRAYDEGRTTALPFDSIRTEMANRFPRFEHRIIPNDLPH